MKKIVYIAVLAICVRFICGCEVDSATEELKVTPESARVKRGQSVEFHVTGGYHYRWSLEQESWGMLSSRTGDTTVYTSLYSPDTNEVAVQVITVSSTIPGSAGGTTNAPGYEITAKVYVIHER